jgi:hypothetical protein
MQYRLISYLQLSRCGVLMPWWWVRCTRKVEMWSSYAVLVGQVYSVHEKWIYMPYRAHTEFSTALNKGGKYF